MLGLVGFVSIAAVILGVVAFAAAIWLVVVAFRKSTPWGLLTLLVPFAAVVFAVKHWSDARRPFLVSLGASVASMLLFFTAAGLAASTMSGELADPLAADPAFREDGAGAPDAGSADAAPTAAEPDALPTPTDDRGAQIASLRVLANPARAAAPATPLYDLDEVSQDGYAPIKLRDAAKLLGRRAKLVTAGGRVHRGELLRADADGVSLERWMRGGSVVLDFGKREIETLYVDVN